MSDGRGSAGQAAIIDRQGHLSIRGEGDAGDAAQVLVAELPDHAAISAIPKTHRATSISGQGQRGVARQSRSGDCVNVPIQPGEFFRPEDIPEYNLPFLAGCESQTAIAGEDSAIHLPSMPFQPVEETLAAHLPESDRPVFAGSKGQPAVRRDAGASDIAVMFVGEVFTLPRIQVQEKNVPLKSGQGMPIVRRASDTANRHIPFAKTKTSALILEWNIRLPRGLRLDRRGTRISQSALCFNQLTFDFHRHSKRDILERSLDHLDPGGYWWSFLLVKDRFERFGVGDLIQGDVPHFMGIFEGVHRQVFCRRVLRRRRNVLHFLKRHERGVFCIINGDQSDVFQIAGVRSKRGGGRFFLVKGGQRDVSPLIIEAEIEANTFIDRREGDVIGRCRGDQDRSFAKLARDLFSGEDFVDIKLITALASNLDRHGELQG
jgi:hypothetical protein